MIEPVFDMTKRTEKMTHGISNLPDAREQICGGVRSSSCGKVADSNLLVLCHKTIP